MSEGDPTGSIEIAAPSIYLEGANKEQDIKSSIERAKLNLMEAKTTEEEVEAGESLLAIEVREEPNGIDESIEVQIAALQRDYDLLIQGKLPVQLTDLNKSSGLRKVMAKVLGTRTLNLQKEADRKKLQKACDEFNIKLQNTKNLIQHHATLPTYSDQNKGTKELYLELFEFKRKGNSALHFGQKVSKLLDHYDLNYLAFNSKSGKFVSELLTQGFKTSTQTFIHDQALQSGLIQTTIRSAIQESIKAEKVETTVEVVEDSVLYIEGLNPESQQFKKLFAESPVLANNLGELYRINQYLTTIVSHEAATKSDLQARNDQIAFFARLRATAIKNIHLENLNRASINYRKIDYKTWESEAQESINSDLNKLLPGYAIVRDPNTQGPNEIDRRYWQKQINLRERIKGELFAADLNVFSSREAFTEWILNLHTVSTKDVLGFYGGKSEVGFGEDDIGRLRNKGDGRIFANIPHETLDNIYLIAKRLNPHDPIIEFYDNQLNGKFMPVQVEGVVSGDFSRFEGRKVFDSRKEASKIYQQSSPSGILIPSSHPLEASGFEFPDSEKIGEYLDVMRNELKIVVESLQAIPPVRELILDHIANYYKAALTSQAVKSVWNSINMNILNSVLDKLGMKQVPHGYLDYEAFLMAPETFRKWLKDYVYVANSNI